MDMAQEGICLKAMEIEELKHVMCEGKAVNGTPSHSYRVALATSDHTGFPTTRHK